MANTTRRVIAKNRYAVLSQETHPTDGISYSVMLTTGWYVGRYPALDRAQEVFDNQRPIIDMGRISAPSTGDDPDWGI